MNDFDSIIKRMTVTHVRPEDYTGADGRNRKPTVTVRPWPI